MTTQERKTIVIISELFCLSVHFFFVVSIMARLNLVENTALKKGIGFHIDKSMPPINDVARH